MNAGHSSGFSHTAAEPSPLLGPCFYLSSLLCRQTLSASADSPVCAMAQGKLSGVFPRKIRLTWTPVAFEGRGEMEVLLEVKHWYWHIGVCLHHYLFTFVCVHADMIAVYNINMDYHCHQWEFSFFQILQWACDKYNFGIAYRFYGKENWGLLRNTVTCLRSVRMVVFWVMFDNFVCHWKTRDWHCFLKEDGSYIVNIQWYQDFTCNKTQNWKLPR